MREHIELAVWALTQMKGYGETRADDAKLDEAIAWLRSLSTAEDMATFESLTKHADDLFAAALTDRTVANFEAAYAAYKIAYQAAPEQGTRRYLKHLRRMRHAIGYLSDERRAEFNLWLRRGN